MRDGHKIIFTFGLTAKFDTGEERLCELSLELDDGTAPFTVMMMDKALAQLRTEALRTLAAYGDALDVMSAEIKETEAAGQRMKDVLKAACPNDGSEQPIDVIKRRLDVEGSTPSDLLKLTMDATGIDKSAGMQIWLLIVLLGVFGSEIEKGSLDV